MKKSVFRSKFITDFVTKPLSVYSCYSLYFIFLLWCSIYFSPKYKCIGQIVLFQTPMDVCRYGVFRYIFSPHVLMYWYLRYRVLSNKALDCPVSLTIQNLTVYPWIYNLLCSSVHCFNKSKVSTFFNCLNKVKMML